MDVVFRGTRGSYPLHAPGFTSLGGNTSCVELHQADSGKLLLDAGSGLLHVTPTPHTDVIFLSHLHVDHIVGLPHFIGKKKSIGGELVLASGVFSSAGEFKEAIDKFYGGRYFPIQMQDILPMLKFECIGNKLTTISDWEIERVQLNHPGGCFGGKFRHTHSVRSIVYASDHEHGTKQHNNLTDFSQGADLLIYDSSYSEENYPKYIGWGHSTWQCGVDTANQANVKRVAITHHDVDRSDAEAQAIAGQLTGSPAFIARDHLHIAIE